MSLTMSIATPQMGISSFKTFSKEKVAWLALLVVGSLAPAGSLRLPWEDWSWDLPQQPIEHFFRRHDTMPVKKPTYQCECPPNEECKIEYKINEEAIDFLKIRGVLKDKDVQQYKDDIRRINEKVKAERRMRARARRELAEDDEPCCCPPKTLMMPTFITNKRFDNFKDYVKTKQMMQ